MIMALPRHDSQPLMQRYLPSELYETAYRSSQWEESFIFGRLAATTVERTSTLWLSHIYTRYDKQEKNWLSHEWTTISRSRTSLVGTFGWYTGNTGQTKTESIVISTSYPSNKEKKWLPSRKEDG